MKSIRLSAILLATVLAVASGSALAEGDAEKGKKVFKKCKACHSLVAGKKKIGPSLYGVFERVEVSARTRLSQIDRIGYWDACLR